MEIIKTVDLVLIVMTLSLFIGFIVFPRQREKIALLIAICYTVDAPFDIVLGRHFAFWVGMANSLLYLWVFNMMRKDRLAEQQEESE